MDTLIDIRPSDYIDPTSPRTSLENLERIFDRARSRGHRIRLTLNQGNLIPGRAPDSRRLHDYTTGTILALYRSSEVIIKMADGRRWVHKSHAQPQQIFEDATMRISIDSHNGNGAWAKAHEDFIIGDLGQARSILAQVLSDLVRNTDRTDGIISVRARHEQTVLCGAIFMLDATGDDN